MTLTTPVSAFITGYVMHKLGRINAMRLSVLPYVAGWICIALAQDMRMIILGRILSGSSLGRCSLVRKSTIVITWLLIWPLKSLFSLVGPLKSLLNFVAL